MNDEFYTFTQYMKKDLSLLTASGEDYLEMIYRLSKDSSFTRVNELAASLNVQPPSATRMVKRLSELGYITYEKYSIITLTEKGKKTGEYLLKRHKTLEEFLELIQVTDSFNETEKIEHTLNDEAIYGIQCLSRFFNENKNIKDQFFSEYLNNK